jgi:phenylalanyl-tRNA synthetase beta chain
LRCSHIDTFHTGRQALIQVDGLDIGSLGEIHPVIQRQLDIPQRIYFAEINLSDLLKAKKIDIKMQALSPFPSSKRDWTITLQEEVAIGPFISSIQRVPSKILEKVSLVDIFRSDKIGAGVKNVTLNFIYRDSSTTLSQERIDQEHLRIISAAEKMLYPQN